MKRHVVDASVVAAAFFREEHATPARSILNSGDELLVPDLLYAELGNVVWKRHARGEIDEHEAEAILADMQALPLKTTACCELAQSALVLAIRTRRTVYDCLYLALAIKMECALITCDKRFFQALVTGALARNLFWIGNWK